MSADRVSRVSPLRGQEGKGSAAPGGMPQRRDLTSLQVTLPGMPGEPPRVEQVAVPGLARDVLVHWALPLLARARRVLDDYAADGVHVSGSILAEDIAALIGHDVTDQPPADELAAVLADGTPARVTPKMLRTLPPDMRNALTPDQLPTELPAPVGHPQDVGPIERAAQEAEEAAEEQEAAYLAALRDLQGPDDGPELCAMAPLHSEPLHVQDPKSRESAAPTEDIGSAAALAALAALQQLPSGPLGEATPAQLPADLAELAEPVCDCDAVQGGGHLLRCAVWTR